MSLRTKKKTDTYEIILRQNLKITVIVRWVCIAIPHVNTQKLIDHGENCNSPLLDRDCKWKGKREPFSLLDTTFIR